MSLIDPTSGKYFSEYLKKKIKKLSVKFEQEIIIEINRNFKCTYTQMLKSIYIPKKRKEEMDMNKWKKKGCKSKKYDCLYYNDNDNDKAKSCKWEEKQRISLH